MKKINALIAAFTLVIAAVTSITSVAADAETPNPDTKDINISRTYPTSYTLTIPASPVELTDSKKVECSVNAYLEYESKLTVTVDSKNGWQLEDQNHSDNDSSITYKLKDGERDLTETGKNIVMTVTDSDNNKDMTTELTFCEFGDAAYAGTYSDTLTFKVTPGTLSAEEKAARTTTVSTTATTTTTTTATEAAEPETSPENETT